MVNTKINDKYELILPEHRSAREEWSGEEGWEKKRINLMVEVISPSDTVFYIGVEEGDIATILLKYCKCNMVLFEPNERVYPCIREIIVHNSVKAPLDFYKGFASDKTIEPAGSLQGPTIIGIEGDMISDHGFKQLYEEYPDVPQITIDEYCQRRGHIPTVITADIEGSEWLMLKGAEQTLRKYKPIIFLSVHPVFMYIHYKQEVGEMLQWMKQLGYKWSCIDYAIHEHHLIFTHE